MGGSNFKGQGGCCWASCTNCGAICEDFDNESFFCVHMDDGEFSTRRPRDAAHMEYRERRSGEAPLGGKSGRRRGATGKSLVQADKLLSKRIEELTERLFVIHDLNGDGMLQEEELISLNECLAKLHHGADYDTTEVRSTYFKLFREKLDPNGNAVPFEVFRNYAMTVLDDLDDDPEAQEMILEQFVAEAESGVALFDRVGTADVPAEDEVLPGVLKERGTLDADFASPSTKESSVCNIDDELERQLGTSERPLLPRPRESVGRGSGGPTVTAARYPLPAVLTSGSPLPDPDAASNEGLRELRGSNEVPSEFLPTALGSFRECSDFGEGSPANKVSSRLLIDSSTDQRCLRRFGPGETANGTGSNPAGSSGLSNPVVGMSLSKCSTPLTSKSNHRPVVETTPTTLVF